MVGGPDWTSGSSLGIIFAHILGEGVRCVATAAIPKIIVLPQLGLCVAPADGLCSASWVETLREMDGVMTPALIVSFAPGPANAQGDAATGR